MWYVYLYIHIYDDTYIHIYVIKIKEHEITTLTGNWGVMGGDGGVEWCAYSAHAWNSQSNTFKKAYNMVWVCYKKKEEALPAGGLLDDLSDTVLELISWRRNREELSVQSMPGIRKRLGLRGWKKARVARSQDKGTGWLVGRAGPVHAECCRARRKNMLFSLNMPGKHGEA